MVPIRKEPVADEEKSKLQATIQQLKTELFEKETVIFIWLKLNMNYDYARTLPTSKYMKCMLVH